jgi:hypothetical protein
VQPKLISFATKPYQSVINEEQIGQIADGIKNGVRTL